MFLYSKQTFPPHHSVLGRIHKLFWILLQGRFLSPYLSTFIHFTFIFIIWSPLCQHGLMDTYFMLWAITQHDFVAQIFPALATEGYLSWPLCCSDLLSQMWVCFWVTPSLLALHVAPVWSCIFPAPIRDYWLTSHIYLKCILQWDTICMCVCVVKTTVWMASTYHWVLSTLFWLFSAQGSCPAWTYEVALQMGLSSGNGREQPQWAWATFLRSFPKVGDL